MAKITYKLPNGSKKSFRHFGDVIRYEDRCWGPSIYTVLSDIVGGMYQVAEMKDYQNMVGFIVVERMCFNAKS